MFITKNSVSKSIFIILFTFAVRLKYVMYFWKVWSHTVKCSEKCYIKKSQKHEWQDESL